ncbi:sodium:proton antiporter [Pontibacillus halophilus JSM 076056 = DSM 19796]|uniref:Sodium:proton antiporter n=1 Tax=Pontibacillus halophilus JSM 076056 = DSM 19796 TaxID=1385510 RepID=A0A0A5GGV7_9BACI|nr:dicarboxylate/amino acid:cation symporter [Pontibacillus halophilus]KGX92466.1 sodium:proton antiporter [Pontibacillus halophilus JSM 076056 = DSM 19796]
MKIGLLPKLLVAIALGIVAGSFLPEEGIRGFATFNGLFSNFLDFIIPLIIVGFIAPGIGELGRGAGKTVGLTAGIAYASTVLAGLLAYGVAKVLYPSFLTFGGLSGSYDNPEEFLQEPFFTLNMPPLFSVMTALVFAFILGLGMSRVEGNALLRVMDEFRQVIKLVIQYVIIPLLPFHIFGIFANMTFGGQVAMIMSTFLKVFAIIILVHLTMLLLQYSAAAGVSKRNLFSLLKTMIPAYFTALGTQSSASTIPVTLEQTKKNGVRSRVADFVVPLGANIHLSGSMITIVSLATAVMMLRGDVASFLTMLQFVAMLGVIMVAAPGVPGGGVMAAVPILTSVLAFDSTMISLMIALYLAQDSFGTATNVTGDGAISVLVDRFTSDEAFQAEEQGDRYYQKVSG